MTMTVEELRERFETLRAAKKAADAAADAAARESYAAELRLYEAEGRPNTLRAGWLRAWLGGDMKECERLLALLYPAHLKDEVEAKAALLRQVEAQP